MKAYATLNNLVSKISPCLALCNPFGWIATTLGQSITAVVGLIWNGSWGSLSPRLLLQTEILSISTSRKNSQDNWGLLMGKPPQFVCVLWKHLFLEVVVARPIY